MSFAAFASRLAAAAREITLLAAERTIEDKSKGGIILPDNTKEKPAEGKILAVGPGRINEHGVRVVPDVRPGDRVLFSKYEAVDVTIDGSTVTFVRADALTAVLED